MLQSRPAVLALGLAFASGALTAEIGCTEPTSKSAPSSTTKSTTASSSTASPPKAAQKTTAKPANRPPATLGAGSLPPRVQTLATSGSAPMKALIQRAQGQTGVDAAKSWVEAGDLAKNALEVASALDLYQLGQRAAPKACAPFQRARLLVTEIGKVDVALMLLNTELGCDGADKTALRKEGERLQKLLVDGIHAHGGSEKAPAKAAGAAKAAGSK